MALVFFSPNPFTFHELYNAYRIKAEHVKKIKIKKKGETCVFQKRWLLT